MLTSCNRGSSGSIINGSDWFLSSEQVASLVLQPIGLDGVGRNQK